MFDQSVTVLKGVGEETAKDLEQLGITTLEELLYHFPYRYENYQLKELADALHDEKLTVEGQVQSEPVLRYIRKNLSRLTFRLFVGEHLISVVAFNKPFLKKLLQLGDTVQITGKWDMHRATLTAVEVRKGGQEREHVVEPVYTLRGNLTMRQMRTFIKQALVMMKSQALGDPIPLSLRQAYKLPPRLDALEALHFPKDRISLKHARRRMIYEEFLIFQLKMQAYRAIERREIGGRAVKIDQDKVDRFIDALPFELTEAQSKVTKSILHDLKLPIRMNRLLQGDVGSGKTVVAAIALFAVVQGGLQGALMVPTEILAEQHAESLNQLFAPFDIQVGLLTSRVKGTARKHLLASLKNGELQILVGTHALIQDEVVFKDLGLVITDEQHRFGVEQRRLLRAKGEQSDVLYMTATPIPRTLAISAFGDMDISSITEMPAGRKPIETYWVKHKQMSQVLDMVLKELEKGRQAYVICPLIEESEALDVQNAIDLHAALQETFSKYQIGLMHGRLNAEEKDEVMEAFKNNEVQLLVSTTVVEVGVNVPNATLMIIYDADRFGLAQLHQLRGRVGRGDAQAYCVLVSDAKSEVSKERMRIMTETTNGFELSEQDLKLRGPGDYFGSKQSGLPDFKIADVVHDFKALEVAREDAASMINSDDFWTGEDYRMLRELLKSQGVFETERLD
ncbi:ATP-dependent DNA helicase RecG [Pullulanibacillus sp. KACC 23026]|uniref:ATP-dependent DNA helicase RecG n=1 Tax=Pullulanibacillus sp. KACC 23026 TaxID=3028315 RepID=UPI0023B0A402|nr:ATP-dependent DNA helicase RecG [Pullulanibacillus sp. KACC 23026]WEG11619.1 ATP-dependent DNA helicase RecG [Pullulanibacillus sp. KACC 23026]